MKQIIFTRHAETVCRERLIELEWVQRAIAEPETVEADPQSPGLLRAFRPVPERDGRVLRVVYTDLPDEVRVITAFFDRSRRR